MTNLLVDLIRQIVAQQDGGEFTAAGIAKVAAAEKHTVKGYLDRLERDGVLKSRVVTPSKENASQFKIYRELR